MNESIGLVDEQTPRGISGRASPLRDHKSVFFATSLAKSNAGTHTSHAQKTHTRDAAEAVLEAGTL